MPFRQSHLDRLESESIYILREVAAQFRTPVLLYSIGKDSSVLLHLALKAFRPARLPFPGATPSETIFLASPRPTSAPPPTTSTRESA